MKTRLLNVAIALVALLCGSATASAVNTAPVITSLSTSPASGPLDPADLPIGSLLNVDFRFADPDVGDSWTGWVDWGDGSPAAILNAMLPGLTYSAAHAYTGLPGTAFIGRAHVTDNAPDSDTRDFSVLLISQAVPEPATLTLLGLGLASLAVLQHCRARRRSAGLLDA